MTAPRLAAGTATLVIFAAVLVILNSPGLLSASGPRQGGADAPEISEPECSFWLDHNNDGEGDEPFDAEPDNYILQETPIIGGCTFKLNARESATLIFQSELKDWEAEVETKREPGPSEYFNMYPAGRAEIPGIKGSMRVDVRFRRGDTPRSGKSRTQPDNYRHEVQIPQEFRLLEITAIAPDGGKDRLEQSVRSASGAYINVQRRIERAGDLPEWAITLGGQWLEEGYPQVADSVVATATDYPDSGSGGSAWWMWTAITTWIVIIAGVGILAIVLRRNSNKEEPRPPPTGNL